jgi:hypothetical protein
VGATGEWCGERERARALERGRLFIVGAGPRAPDRTAQARSLHKRRIGRAGRVGLENDPLGAWILKSSRGLRAGRNDGAAPARRSRCDETAPGRVSAFI